MASTEIGFDRDRIQQGHQRFLESFLGESDRVPLGAPLNEHALYLLGLSGLDFATDPLVAVRAQLLLSEYYDLDSLLLAYDCYNIEAEALGQQLIYTEKAMPDLDPLNPLIREKADLDRLVPPRPGESGRMPYILQMYRLYQEYTGAPGGKFSLSLNYVPADTPPAHIAAAVEAVKQFGRYPIGEMDLTKFQRPEVEPLEDFLRRKGPADL